MTEPGYSDAKEDAGRKKGTHAGRKKQTAIKEFGIVEHWKQHYLEVTSSKKMQKKYAKMVAWYGEGAAEFFARALEAFYSEN